MKFASLAAAVLFAGSAFAGEAAKTAIETGKSLPGVTQQKNHYSVRFMGPESVGKALEMYKAIPAELSAYKADIVIAAAMSGKSLEEILPIAKELSSHTSYDAKYALSVLGITGGSFTELDQMSKSLSWCPSDDIRIKMAYALSITKADPSVIAQNYKKAAPNFAQDKALLALLATDRNPIDLLNQIYTQTRNTDAKGAATAAMVLSGKRLDEINQLNKDLVGKENGFNRAQLTYVCAMTDKTPQELREMRKKFSTQGTTAQTINNLTLLAALMKTDTGMMQAYYGFIGNIMNSDKGALVFAASVMDLNEKSRSELVKHMAITQFLN